MPKLRGKVLSSDFPYAGGVGFEPTTTGLGGLRHYPIIDFTAVEGDFQVWLQSRNLSVDYYEGMLSSLRRFGGPVRLPIDVAKMFQTLSPGQKHGLIRAVRNLFNFYECQGFAEKNWLDLLRKNIPRDECGFDIKVPAETQIVRSLRQLSSDSGHQAHFALYNLILDSGIRVIEAVKLAENLQQTPIEKVGGFYVATLGMMRKVKLAYYAFFTEYTMGLLKGLQWTIGYETARKLKAKAGTDLISYKYLRKFLNDTMTDEKLNIPESVADFIQGRVPKSVGAKHYMRLKRKAIGFYPRYARYIEKLREKALN